MKIIWLKTGPLHPLDTGGKIRTGRMLGELKRRHEVTYVSLCPESCAPSVLDGAEEYSSRQVWIPWRETAKDSPAFYLELAMNLLSPLPYVIEKYRSRRMAEEIRALEDSQQADLIVCDFLTPSVNLFPGCHRGRTPMLLFQHNIESRIWQRMFENARGLKRAYFRSQWRRMLAYEKRMGARFDGVAGVSEDDCRVMRDEFGLKNVLGAVPTGVDLAYFCPSTTQRQRHSLVFLGSMDWRPNIDGACYFAAEIFPLIRRKFPQATLTIVGRNPAPQIRELAAGTAGIRVTGTVADVRPHLAEAEVMVVPLRIGGGTRIKIYEAMATGIPVIATTIGAEGLPVTHGENIFLADMPGEFIHGVCELFDRPEQRVRLSGGGLALVQREGSWASVSRVFEEFCLKVCNQAVRPN